MAAIQLIKDDEPDVAWGSGAMEFRLTYEGQLLGASKSSTRANHKHAIRKRLHPQLKRLWEVAPQLSSPTAWDQVLITKVGDEPLPHTIAALSARFERPPFRFVPLVTANMSLLCSIDILFLRPGTPGTILSSGDIDNRLKTLFDALRVPADLAEMGGATPEVDEDPMFVLLQDDSLVTRVSVETDVLLAPVSDTPTPNDARLTLTVRLRPYAQNLSNLHLG